MSFRRLAFPLILLSTAALAQESKPASQPAAPLPRAELDKLIAQTDAIAKTVAELRGLEPKHKIPRGVMSRAEITKRLITRIDEDYGPGELVAEERTLKRLGLMPADMDYRQTVIDLLTEQIAGFYDPESKELYIADWIDPSVQRVVMAHEIDHALQDQRFDLLRFTKPLKDNTDEQMAHQALVEGDGVALMIEFMMRETGQKLDPWANDTMVNLIAASANLGGGVQIDKAPLFLKDSLLFPYEAGLRFIVASRRTHPWSDVDSMYRNPPQSTEQIIHPEKYRAGDKPVAVKAAPLPSLKGFKQIYDNVVGEMMWSVLLRQHGVAKDKADRAAAGWGGDRMVTLAPAGSGTGADGLVVVDLSVWDAEADAVEMFDALSEAILKLTSAPDFDEKSPALLVAHDKSGAVTTLERRKDRLVLVVGAPLETAGKIRGEAWTKWKVGAR